MLRSATVLSLLLSTQVLARPRLSDTDLAAVVGRWDAEEMKRHGRTRDLLQDVKHRKNILFLEPLLKMWDRVSERDRGFLVYAGLGTLAGAGADTRRRLGQAGRLRHPHSRFIVGAELSKGPTAKLANRILRTETLRLAADPAGFSAWKSAYAVWERIKKEIPKFASHESFRESAAALRKLVADEMRAILDGKEHNGRLDTLRFVTLSADVKSCSLLLHTVRELRRFHRALLDSRRVTRTGIFLLCFEPLRHRGTLHQKKQLVDIVATQLRTEDDEDLRYRLWLGLKALGSELTLRPRVQKVAASVPARTPNEKLRKKEILSGLHWR